MNLFTGDGFPAGTNDCEYSIKPYILSLSNFSIQTVSNSSLAIQTNVINFSPLFVNQIIA